MGNWSYDFTGFIRDNQEIIFDNAKKDYCTKYAANIAALDQKMNELISGGNDFNNDKKLLFGLFIMTLGQISRRVKPDITILEQKFYDFLEKTKKQP